MVATRRATRAASSKRTGYIFCILLAAQYGLQPFLKVFIADGVNKVSLVLGTEMAKVLLGLAGMLYEGSLASNFAAWNPKGAAFAVIPSLIYAAQNYLLVFGYQTMDSVTFNCLNQSKLVSTALCLYLLFGTKQSLVQMGALAGLLIAGVMLQDGGGESQGANTAASEAETAVGVAAVLAASALSGVASAACQYAMQRIGTSAHVFTLEMAFVAIPALLISQASVISARDPAALFTGLGRVHADTGVLFRVRWHVRGAGDQELGGHREGVRDRGWARADGCGAGCAGRAVAGDEEPRGARVGGLVGVGAQHPPAGQN